MSRVNRPAASDGRGAGPGRGATLLLGLFSLLLLVVACLAGIELFFGAPALAGTSQADIRIEPPTYAPPDVLPRAARLAGDILPVTSSPAPLALRRSAVAPLQASPTGTALVTSPTPAASVTDASPTASGAPAGGSTPGALQPTFEITPETGQPGMPLAASGQGWPPNDVIAIRIQDPANPQTLQLIYPVATVGPDGRWTAAFTVPNTPPWANLTAVLLWAVSSNSGIQVNAPEPFVTLQAAVSTATPAPPNVSAAVTPTATATATLTPTSAVAPGSATPTSLAGTATPETTAQPTPEATETPTPEATEYPTPTTPASTTYGSPLPTPAAGVFQSPLPAPTSTAPGVLPAAGDPVLPTAFVRATGVALRAAPSLQAAVWANLAPDSAVGVIAQDPTGGWLMVIEARGVAGWVPRAAVDFSG